MNKHVMIFLPLLLCTLAVSSGCSTGIVVEVRDSSTHSPSAGVAVHIIAGNHNPIDWYRHAIVEYTDNTGRAHFAGIANQTNLNIEIAGARATVQVPPSSRDEQWSALVPTPSRYEIAVYSAQSERQSRVQTGTQNETAEAKR